MPREMARRRDARRARHAVKAGTVEKRSLSVDEVSQFLRVIDQNAQHGFGIRQLASVAVDDLLVIKGWGNGGAVTLLDYACWRGRDSHVLSLLNAGANLTHGTLPSVAMDPLPRPYVAWLAKAAAEMRRRSLNVHTRHSDVLEVLAVLPAAHMANATDDAFKAAHNKLFCGACACGTELCKERPDLLVMAPCGHTCCSSCIWRPFSRTLPSEELTYADEGELLDEGCIGVPELRCSVCNQEYALGSEIAPRERATPRSPEAATTSVESSCFSSCNLSWLPSFAVRWRERRTARQRAFASYEKWLALPDAMPRSKDEWARVRLVASDKNIKSSGRIKMGAFRAMTAQECANSRLGLTRTQRCSRVRQAAERGDARRLRALLEAGANIGDRDEYGHTPLLAASWRGHSAVVDLLLRWGADANIPASGGKTPLAAASTQGHTAVMKVLSAARAAGGVSPRHEPLSAVRVGTLVPVPATLAGIDAAKDACACYLDGVFSDSFLCELEALWRSLPVAAKSSLEPSQPSVQERRRQLSEGRYRGDRSQMDEAPQRSYFADLTGWVTGTIASVLARPCEVQLLEPSGVAPWPHSLTGGLSPCRRAYAHMRFLHYALEGGYLAPHTDLARTDEATGERSTHTFLLYLGDGQEAGATSPAGGETVLLESLEFASPALATVVPKRGRLFMFPHGCPHKAMPVVRPPKLLLRGELV